MGEPRTASAEPSGTTRSVPPSPDQDALLCALVLAPGAFSRNRYFHLFETDGAKRTRRRAKRLRGVVRQLLGQGREPAEIVGEAVLDDGRVLLRYRIESLSFERTTAMSALESALVRYALHRASGAPLADGARNLVETSIARLGADISLEK